MGLSQVASEQNHTEKPIVYTQCPPRIWEDAMQNLGMTWLICGQLSTACHPKQSLAENKGAESKKEERNNIQNEVFVYN